MINLKYTDEELEPLYQIWFAQNSILVNYKNVWGKIPLELAEQIEQQDTDLGAMIQNRTGNTGGRRFDGL